MSLENKKVVIIIAPERFRDEEYVEPRKILEEAGASITVASSATGTVTGMLGAVVTPDISIEEVRPEEYDAVIFVGGGGASAYFDDEIALSIAKEAARSRVLGAICIAPRILANAGLLKGKRATVFSTQIEALKALGADYTGAPVERDGDIITAEGPTAAPDFGRAVLAALEER